MDASKLQNFLNAQKARAMRGTQNTTRFLKLKNGESRFVILPGWNPEAREAFAHPYGAHWYTIPGMTSKKGGDVWGAYVCNEKTHDQPCEFCKMVREATSAIQSDEEAGEFRRKWMAQQTYLLNVLALDSETPDQPQVLQVCKTVFEQLMNTIAQWGARIFDENNPQVLVIKRQKNGPVKVDYSVMIAPETVSMPHGVLDKLIDLDAACASGGEESLRKIVGVFSMNNANVIEAPRQYAQIAAAPAVAAATVAVTDAVVVDEGLDDIPFDCQTTAPTPVETPVETAKAVGLDDDFSDLMNL